MSNKKGGFIISLDFELMWGVRDKKTVENYGESIRTVHQIVPQLLNLFRRYKIKATWATVGLLFAENEADLLACQPKEEPSYLDQNLTPYSDVDNHKKNFANLNYWCYSLIDLIKTKYPEQELSTHTFSHYYCLENGQTIHQFEEDIIAAVQIAKRKNIEITSIVFPRNQVREDYLKVCKKHGITNYRGVEKAWFYRAEANSKESKAKRAFRLLDSYINISGHNTFQPSKENVIIDIPASRFFRPYSQKLSFLEKTKVKRIQNDLSYAAKNGEYYHLWWHPHNFGTNKDKMFEQLEEILKHVSDLTEKYNFRSFTMSEATNSVS